MKKRQKTVKNKVFEKIIEVGSVLVWIKNVVTNVLVVVIAADYFAEAPEEVLVKMTKGKPEKELKNHFFAFIRLVRKPEGNVKSERYCVKCRNTMKKVGVGWTS